MENAQVLKATSFGRKVEVKLRDWIKNEELGKKEAQDHTETGVFHQWGINRVCAKGSPPTMQTVGIIELENGEVIRLLPEFITFMEPMKELVQH